MNQIMWNKDNESVNAEKQAFESSSSSSCSTSSREILKKIKLNVVLTNRGLQIYGTWGKDKLLGLLTDRLRQSANVEPGSATKRNSYDILQEKRLHMTVYSGLYSVRVLKDLQNKGMPLYTILKGMKLGLTSLDQAEILYFKDYKIEPHAMQYREIWKKCFSNEFSNELILNLQPTSLSVTECWDIIIYGVVLQNQSILRHLALSGIDVPGILNWQSPIKSASSKIIAFLRHIGIGEEDVQLVEQYGVDEETEQMLIDLGLNEMEEKCSDMEEIICRCSLTILEPICRHADVTEKVHETGTKSSSDYSNAMEHYPLCNCQCHVLEQNQTEADMNARRNDYLRQNIMVPLVWAMARTLRYKPTDPLHYTAYQLLRWIHGNVSETNKDCVHQVFTVSTMAMDRKLIMKRRLEEEEQIRIQNEEATKNIPCEICKDRQELRRIKTQCWQCVRGLLKTFESCEFPDVCSSCKINVSHKSDDLSTPRPL